MGIFLTKETVNSTNLNQSYWWRWCGHIWSRSWLRGLGAHQRLRAGSSPLWRTASRASVAGWDDLVQNALCHLQWLEAEGPRQQSPNCWSRRRPARQTQLRSEKVYWGETNNKRIRMKNVLLRSKIVFYSRAHSRFQFDVLQHFVIFIWPIQRSKRAE